MVLDKQIILRADTGEVIDCREAHKLIVADLLDDGTAPCDEIMPHAIHLPPSREVTGIMVGDVEAEPLAVRTEALLVVMIFTKYYFN